jgi:hypothetical protein
MIDGLTRKRTLIGIAVLLLGIAAHAPAAYADIVIDDGGTQKKSVPIKCGDHEGTVSVNTGVKLTETVKGVIAPEIEQTIITKYGNAIGLTYKGTNCADCKWLQFVWREVLATDAKGEAPVRGKMPTSAGLLPLTTNPAAPSYAVDSGSKTDPSYGATGISTTTADSQNMYDQPGPGFPPNLQKDATITKLRSLAHFDAFLVCGGKVCAKVTWTVSWTWTPGPGGGTTTGPTYDVPDPDTSGAKPNDAQMKQLNAQYPGQTVLK